MSKTILITGGSGLVGSRLTTLLKERGYQVNWLSRSPESQAEKSFHWDPTNQLIEGEAIENCDAIIHLAGASIAESKWTDKQKKKIRDSRVQGTQLIRRAIANSSNKPSTVVCASAIGYYGMDTGIKLNTEDSQKGNDFISDVVSDWEQEIKSIEDFGIRIPCLRIGIVMSTQGGALQKIMQPIKYNAGAPLGSGKQYMSWIHIDDLCNMFIYALENDHITDIYNACGPEPSTNTEITKETASQLNKIVLPINVPAFALKLALGEMSGLVLGSCKVSSEKIQLSGFHFKYPQLDECIYDLIKHKK
ncbi:MAG: TIGR01777 family oxidoreductase [Cyclobacteriaceae bacterium]|nr:TIGR01777 family oxidoreductase [Cyclobacteriaceae bacterium]MCH8517108.1 TIGR01777 family oxidoreductase [Cyclobacteriaceae bacterium]